MNIVLLEPEIPQNTGNIGRTCCATGTKLHLIEPMKFRITEKNLKRAGMDYWKDLDVTTYIDFEDFMSKNPGAKIYMATTKAPNVYSEVNFEPDCYIMFGKESAGIPESILVNNQDSDVLEFMGISARKGIGKVITALHFCDISGYTTSVACSACSA